MGAACPYGTKEGPIKPVQLEAGEISAYYLKKLS